VDERLSSLLASLHERFDPAASTEREVRAFLAAEGYEERRIGEILALFYGDPSTAGGRPAVRRKEGGAASPIRQATAFRVLGPHERGRFAPEAWGHLLALSGSGVLNPSELEQVIDRALVNIDGRIALDDLRALLEASGEGEGRSAGGGTTVH
jgi:Smg protein